MANSDNVRRELQAFNLGETKPIFGNLLTLPVGDGLMYVQPVYAVRQLSEASYPILQFVIVSYGDQVGIGNSLIEALADVLGVDPTDPGRPASGDEPDRRGDSEPPDQSTRTSRSPSCWARPQAAFDAGRRGRTARRPGRGGPADRARPRTSSSRRSLCRRRRRPRRGDVAPSAPAADEPRRR